MMESFIASNLAAYSMQVLCLAAASGLLLALLRVNAPGLRYTLLRLTLAACLVLPWLQTRESAAAGAVTTTIAMRSADETGGSVIAPAPRFLDWPSWIPVVLIAGIGVRGLWLAIGLTRLDRLRRAGEPADHAEHLALQHSIGTKADVRYIAGAAQPVTFGLRKPVVVLPDSLRSQPVEIREAVLAHELVHVQRRDWAWVLLEEAARAVFWFHPAVWWLISHIQLAREEVVDALAVARTGRRRAYVEALMAFADGLPLTPAPAFARRRHLFRRMVLISTEDVMTAKRLVISAVAIVAVMAIGGWYVVNAFPLVETTAGQILQKTPGPLESAAKPITPANPIPRRVQHESPQYPPEAASENAWVSITLRLTIDASGSVAEARVTESRLRLGDGVTSLNDERSQHVYDAVVSAAVNAIADWRYEAPVNAPISLDTTLFFAPSLPVSDTPAAAPRSTKRQVDDKALRVGGNVRPPTKIKDVRPVYPPDAQEAKIQGVVIAEVRINEQGGVDDVQILRSIPALDGAALDAIRQWEFVPTLMNGVPTPIIMVVTVQFSLAP